MKHNTDYWAGVFKTLSDPTRLTLLHTIHDAGQNELTVSELAEKTGLRIATASASLRAMEATGTVTSVRRGRSIHYGITSDDVHALLHWMGATHD